MTSYWRSVAGRPDERIIEQDDWLRYTKIYLGSLLPRARASKIGNQVEHEASQRAVFKSTI